MKLLVTGATGFLGRFVVDEALRRGHRVRAVARPASEMSRLEWTNDDRVEIARADLRSSRGLEQIVSGVDAVIHLAADKGGDLYAQLGGTVVATEHLINAMHSASADRIVLTSSFSVYDYRKIRGGSVLDERSPLEAAPAERDAYCQTKLLQEHLVTGNANLRWTVLRPGVIFGPGNEWTARLGMQLGSKRWIRIGGGARLPLTYVENCAEAIVRAAETDEAIGKILNVVDDEMPKQRTYCRELVRRMNPRPSVIPVPYLMMRFLAWSASVANRVLFKGNARVPQIFRSPSLQARCKPLRYDASSIRDVLGWKPRYTLTESLDRCGITQSVATESNSAESAKSSPAGSA